LNANCRAKIVAVDTERYTGTALRGVTMGEIYVTGPNIIKGYYNKPKDTRDSMGTDPDGTR
jgi:4-coumarate--CoA ligase